MIVSVAQTQVFILAVTRVLAIIIKIPVLGGKLIPDRVKVFLGVALALVLVPWRTLDPGDEALTWLPFAFAIGEELIIGTLAGYAAEITFAALQIAGEMMGLASGFFAAKMINPSLNTRGSSVTNFFYMIALTYFVILNGHHQMLAAVQRSFEILPLGSSLVHFPLERLLRLTAGMITTGVQFSLPVVGALMLTNLTLGLLARVAPQVQVFFLGIPLKVGLGLLTLMVTMSILFPRIAEMYDSSADWMLVLLEGN